MIPALPPDLKKKLTPPVTIPSRREAHAGLSPALYVAADSRRRYRVRLLWRDVTTASGRREECFEFAQARGAVNLLELLKKIVEHPDRELLSVSLEAKPTPQWESIGIEYLVWAAARAKRGGAR